jgi:hypothetical protein
MKWLDSPLVAGRTTREIALVGIGLFGVVWGLVGNGPYGIEWSLAWAIATPLFAMRFWAARGIAVGACLAAVAQWVCLTDAREWHWILNVPLAALALLASRDLVARFDETPSRVPWLSNPWATMPAAHARRLRWCAYAAGVLASVLCQMWCSGARSFPATPVFFWSLGAVVALLAMGRAVMLLPLAAAGVAVTVAAMPGALGGHVGSVEAVVCALASLGLATPYLARLLAGPASPARGPRVAAETRLRVAAPLDDELDVAGDDREGELAPPEATRSRACPRR